MSDARWLEVEDDVASAVRHFRNGSALYDEGLSVADDLASYKGRMAFLQAMQAAYTSLEGAFERILEILGEDKPTAGRDYHAQLVRRVGRAIPNDRPAIVTGDLLRAVDEARRFRHVARKSYDDFDVSKTAPAIAAARMLSQRLGGAIEAFRTKIENDGPED
ncbi:MAG: hypothetical protein ACLPN5_11265 [Roseiarcus sp.]